ncbi:MAG: hypothetical protein J6A29_05665 [Clostridia bacterium]|nr:hypothetical protein [Clostridia bacterium]
MNEDLSNLFDKFNINKDSISPEMVNNLMSMLGNNFSNNEQENSNYSENTSNNNTQNTNNSGFGNIDFETIMKMKSIIDKMNIKDDPRSNLLESLKPYLKESRRSKVDQYIQLMNISRVMEVFPFMGGDNKNASK